MQRSVFLTQEEVGVGFVAVSRVDAGKHFPTDVIGGAIIAGYLSNTLWDAHNGVKGKPGIFGRIKGNLAPVALEDGGALLYFIDF